MDQVDNELFEDLSRRNKSLQTQLLEVKKVVSKQKYFIFMHGCFRVSDGMFAIVCRKIWNCSLILKKQRKRIRG